MTDACKKPRPRQFDHVVFFTIFVAVFLITLAASTALAFILPESYASTVRFKIESDVASGTITTAGSNQNVDESYDPYFLQTTFEIIQSPLVLSNVVSALNLNVEWGRKYYGGEILKKTESMDMLRHRMELKTVRNTKLIEITIYSDDKLEAAAIANTVAKAYQAYRENSYHEMADRELSELDQTNRDTARKITQMRNDLAALQKKLNLVDNEPAENFRPPPNPIPENQPYWDGKRKLADQLEFQMILQEKIDAEKMDLGAPPWLVEIVDPARPGNGPARPNKPLDILMGGLCGIVLGAVAGTGVALIAGRSRKRATPPPII